MTPEQRTAERIAQIANILQEVVESVWDHLGTTRCKELGLRWPGRLSRPERGGRDDG